MPRRPTWSSLPNCYEWLSSRPQGLHKTTQEQIRLLCESSWSEFEVEVRDSVVCWDNHKTLSSPFERRNLSEIIIMAPQKKVAIGTIAPNDNDTDSELGFERTLPRDFKLKNNESEDRCTLCSLTRRCFCIVLGILLVVGSVAGLSVAFTGSPNPADYFIPIDPPGAKEAVRWDANSGLYLTVENACDDSWTPYFDRSIADWNKTEALILRTQRVQYDAKCEPSRGRLKVCNGDYGNTPWRGINTAVKNAATGYVIYSVSKLNDYHLKTDDDKAYTMCHENGHGFGLPHTDEDHFNRDRGDCMDYTTRTWNNLDPGQYNYDLLVTLYGTPGEPLTSDPLLDEGSTIAPTMAPRRPPPPPPRPGRVWMENEGEDEDDKDKDKEKDDRRLSVEKSTFDAEVELALESCISAKCEYSIDDTYVIVINKVLL